MSWNHYLYTKNTAKQFLIKFGIGEFKTENQFAEVRITHTWRSVATHYFTILISLHEITKYNELLIKHAFSYAVWFKMRSTYHVLKNVFISSHWQTLSLNPFLVCAPLFIYARVKFTYICLFNIPCRNNSLNTGSRTIVHSHCSI